MADPNAVRLARPSDLRHLAAVEDSGDAQFVEHFGDAIAPSLLWPSLSGFVRDAQPGFICVAGDPVIGFAHVTIHDGDAHMEQLSVLPAEQGRGIGTALIGAACEEARWAGFERLTLCTYRTVPWNAPYYRRLGFVIDEEPTGWAAQCLAREHDAGLDSCDERVVMSIPLIRGQMVTRR